MARYKMFPIDIKKLKRLIRQRGLTLKEVSNELGYKDEYITDCGQRGTMPEPSVKALKNTFGIAYEDYKADPVQEPAEVTKVPEATSWDVLSEVIQSSIRSSIRSAIKDNREELEDMITSAFRKALEG